MPPARGLSARAVLQQVRGVLAHRLEQMLARLAGGRGVGDDERQRVHTRESIEQPNLVSFVQHLQRGPQAPAASEDR